MDHWLLKTQSNAVIEAIKSAGLDPFEFQWEGTRTGLKSAGVGGDVPRVPLLRHKPTQAFFTFEFDGKRRTHHAVFSPGDQVPEEVQNSGTWENQLIWFTHWLGYLKREYQAPDLWAEFKRQRELAGGELAKVENTPFTPDEQRQIEAQLQETKALVRKSFELTEEQYRAIEGHFDYLAEAAQHMRRIDWRNAFVGVFLTAVVSTLLPGEVVRDVIGVSLRSLAGLFGVDIPELPS